VVCIVRSAVALAVLGSALTLSTHLWLGPTGTIFAMCFAAFGFLQGIDLTRREAEPYKAVRSVACGLTCIFLLVSVLLGAIVSCLIVGANLILSSYLGVYTTKS
jgi:hypothetical protein